MKRNFKVLFIALVVLALAGGTFAFAATNTVVNAGKAGEGVSTTVSGYTIDNIVYITNATDRANLDTVTFSTNDVAAKVYVKLDSSSSNWYTCVTPALPDESHGTAWSCTTTSPQLAVVDIDKVDVVASSQ